MLKLTDRWHFFDRWNISCGERLKFRATSGIQMCSGCLDISTTNQGNSLFTLVHVWHRSTHRHHGIFSQRQTHFASMETRTRFFCNEILTYSLHYICPFAAFKHFVIYQWDIPGLFFILFLSFQTNITYFTTNIWGKMSIQYMLLGFELATFRT